MRFFGGFVQPGRNAQSLFYRFLLLLVGRFIKRNHGNKLVGFQVDVRRVARLGIRFAILQHQPNGILRHGDRFVHIIALGKASFNIRHSDGIADFFRMENNRIKNQTHKIAPFGGGDYF